MNATSVRAQTQENLDIILNKGKPAPYTGVLIPEYDYRELASCEENYGNMMGEYMEYRYECDKLTKDHSDGLSKFMWFIIGAGIGIIAGSRI